MASYCIWCRTAEVTPGQYLVTVSAVPLASQDRAGSITSESRLFTAPEVAHAEARAMCDKMRGRVAAQGHHVESVDFV